jgi:hypothetical protein
LPPPLLEQRHQPGSSRLISASLPVVSAREVLARGLGAGLRHAVVVDELGTYEAIGAAEWLLEQGVAVQFITGHRAFAPRLEAALVSAPALTRLRRHGFELHTRAALLAVGPGTCELGWLEGGHPWSVPADLVVMAAPGLPDDPLVQALQAALVAPGSQVLAVGDARHSGTLEDAIRAAHTAAMGLFRSSS